MSKKLQFVYEGKEYTLEFTRKSIQQMESKGFVISDLEAKPVTVLPQLFAGAFIANHRFVHPALIDEIYSKMTNKKELITKLGEMYSEPINALMDDPEEDEGNVSWTTSF